MYAAGHIALSYLINKIIPNKTKQKIDYSILWTLSILPDIDIPLPLTHRGPFHSVVLASLIFIPVFLIYRKRAISYFFSLISHSLLGDIISYNKIMLFWPISNATYSIMFRWKFQKYAGQLEVLVFLLFLIIVIKDKDFINLFNTRRPQYAMIFPVIALFFSSLILLYVDKTSVILFANLSTLVLIILSYNSFRKRMPIM